MLRLNRNPGQHTPTRASAVLISRDRSSPAQLTQEQLRWKGKQSGMAQAEQHDVVPVTMLSGFLGAGRLITLRATTTRFLEALKMTS